MFSKRSPKIIITLILIIFILMILTTSCGNIFPSLKETNETNITTESLLQNHLKSETTVKETNITTESSETTVKEIESHYLFSIILVNVILSIVIIILILILIIKLKNYKNYRLISEKNIFIELNNLKDKIDLLNSKAFSLDIALKKQPNEEITYDLKKQQEEDITHKEPEEINNEKDLIKKIIEDYNKANNDPTEQLINTFFKNYGPYERIGIKDTHKYYEFGGSFELSRLSDGRLIFLIGEFDFGRNLVFPVFHFFKDNCGIPSYITFTGLEIVYELERNSQINEFEIIKPAFIRSNYSVIEKGKIICNPKY